eukprot:4071802-Alexandrium_andersonii.AAC.1
MSLRHACKSTPPWRTKMIPRYGVSQVRHRTVDVQTGQATVASTHSRARPAARVCAGRATQPAC